MYFLNFMTRTEGSPIVYLLRALGVTLLGTVFFILLSEMVFPTSEEAIPTEPQDVSMFAMIIIWPLFTTLLIWCVLIGFKRIAPTYWHAAAGSALVFTALFGLLAGLNGVLIFAWPFFMYSLTFLAWQLKSNLHGYLMTSALQGMVNIIPAVLVASTTS